MGHCIYQFGANPEDVDEKLWIHERWYTTAYELVEECNFLVRGAFLFFEDCPKNGDGKMRDQFEAVIFCTSGDHTHHSLLGACGRIARTEWQRDSADLLTLVASSGKRNANRRWLHS